MDFNIFDKPKADSNIHKYLRREKTFAFILIGLSVITAVIIAVFAPENLWFGVLFSFITTFNASQKYDAVLRTIRIAKNENASVLLDLSEKNFEFLIHAWRDFNIAETEHLKAKWYELLQVSIELRNRDLLNEDTHQMLLENNIAYIDQETKIRLENLRNNK